MPPMVLFFLVKQRRSRPSHSLIKLLLENNYYNLTVKLIGGGGL